MATLIEFAKTELNLVKNLSDQEKEKIMDLITVFSDQGHSGMSDNMTLNIFYRFAKTNPDYGSYIDDLRNKEFLDSESDFYRGLTVKALFGLGQEYYKNNIIGDTIITAFLKVASYKLLTPLTLNDDEWKKIEFCSFQNKRNMAVFKEGKDGKPYYNNAYYMWNKEVGGWDGCLELEDKRCVGKCYIKDVNNMPTIKIKLDIKRYSDKPSDWGFLPCKLDNSGFVELQNYYILEYFDLESEED